MKTHVERIKSKMRPDETVPFFADALSSISANLKELMVSI